MATFQPSATDPVYAEKILILHAAIKKYDLEQVTSILDNSPSLVNAVIMPHQTGNNGDAPLLLAIEFFGNYDNDTIADNKTASNDTKLVLPLSNGGIVTLVGHSNPPWLAPSQKAWVLDRLRLITLLLDRGASIDYVRPHREVDPADQTGFPRRGNALHRALRFGPSHYSIVYLLLLRGANPNSRGAPSYGRMVRTLPHQLEHPLFLSIPNQMPYGAGGEEVRLMMIKALLYFGSDVNAIYENQHILHKAITLGSIAIITTLLEAKAWPGGPHPSLSFSSLSPSKVPSSWQLEATTPMMTIESIENARRRLPHPLMSMTYSPSPSTAMALVRLLLDAGSILEFMTFPLTEIKPHLDVAKLILNTWINQTPPPSSSSSSSSSRAVAVSTMTRVLGSKPQPMTDQMIAAISLLHGDKQRAQCYLDGIGDLLNWCISHRQFEAARWLVAPINDGGCGAEVTSPIMMSSLSVWKSCEQPSNRDPDYILHLRTNNNRDKNDNKKKKKKQTKEGTKSLPLPSPAPTTTTPTPSSSSIPTSSEIKKVPVQPKRLAAAQKAYEMFMLLLQSGGRKLLNIADHNGVTPISFAISNLNKDILEVQQNPNKAIFPCY
jgi:ankyrin repeat protein